MPTHASSSYDLRQRAARGPQHREDSGRDVARAVHGASSQTAERAGVAAERVGIVAGDELEEGDAVAAEVTGGAEDGTPANLARRRAGRRSSGPPTRRRGGSTSGHRGPRSRRRRPPARSDRASTAAASRSTGSARRPRRAARACRATVAVGVPAVELERDRELAVAASRAHCRSPATSRACSCVPASIPNPAQTRTFGAPSATAVSSTAADSPASGGPAANRYDPYDAISTPAATDAARAARRRRCRPAARARRAPHSTSPSPHSSASRATSSIASARSVTEQSPGRITRSRDPVEVGRHHRVQRRRAGHEPLHLRDRELREPHQLVAHRAGHVRRDERVRQRRAAGVRPGAGRAR